MIIDRGCRANNLAIICLAADMVYVEHKCIACLTEVGEKHVSISTRDLLQAERVPLLKDLTASLGAGVSVEWSERLERFDIALTD